MYRSSCDRCSVAAGVVIKCDDAVCRYAKIEDVMMLQVSNARDWRCDDVAGQ